MYPAFFRFHLLKIKYYLLELAVCPVLHRLLKSFTVVEDNNSSNDVNLLLFPDSPLHGQIFYQPASPFWKSLLKFLLLNRIITFMNFAYILFSRLNNLLYFRRKSFFLLSFYALPPPLFAVFLTYPFVLVAVPSYQYIDDTHHDLK